MNTLRPNLIDYLCYSHITPELARLNYWNRFGVDAPETYVEGIYVYVGPKPEQDQPAAPVTQPAPAPIMESQLSFF